MAKIGGNRVATATRVLLYGMPVAGALLLGVPQEAKAANCLTSGTNNMISSPGQTSGLNNGTGAGHLHRQQCSWQRIPKQQCAGYCGFNAKQQHRWQSRPAISMARTFKTTTSRATSGNNNGNGASNNIIAGNNSGNSNGLNFQNNQITGNLSGDGNGDNFQNNTISGNGSGNLNGANSNNNAIIGNAAMPTARAL